MLCRVLNAPRSVNYSIGLYPEVRWVIAFQSHWTTASTVKKPHWRRQKHRHLLKRRGKKKTVLGKSDVENRQTHKQTHKQAHRFLILHLAHTLFTSSCAPKGISQNRCSREETEEGEKKKCFLLVLFKTQTPTLKIPTCKLGLKPTMFRQHV